MAETSKSTTKADVAEAKNATRDEQKERLDSELADSFPASDPPSLTQPTTEVGAPDRDTMLMQETDIHDYKRRATRPLPRRLKKLSPSKRKVSTSKPQLGGILKQR
jgi:hypothetical protein